MVMQWCRCTPFNIPDKQGQVFPVLVLFYTTHTLHIFAIDTNLQYFAFSYILIICSLHKFSYDSQIHNILTCVNTLHFSESIFFILCVWRFAWCRNWSVWYIMYTTCFGIYPTQNITFTFSVLFFSLTFSINHPTQSHFKKMHFCYTCTSFNHSSHLIPPNSSFEIILQFCLTFTFSIIHPTQSHFWNCFTFLNNFPFFQSFIPPKSHPQT